MWSLNLLFLSVALVAVTGMPTLSEVFADNISEYPTMVERVQALMNSTYHYQPTYQTNVVPSYVATVSYGPNVPSLIYTCILNQLFPQASLNAPNVVQGPSGYTCTITQGKPAPISEPAVVVKPTEPPVQVTQTPEPATPQSSDLGSGILDTNGNVIMHP